MTSYALWPSTNGLRWSEAELLSRGKLLHIALVVVASSALIAGCRGRPVAGELEARQSLADVQRIYRPDDRTLALPALHENASLRDYLLFAMMNSPSVEAAYYDWAASVERITTARSLPDPQLSFQSDIAESVMSLMPGLMMDFPGPGKLKAAAGVATAESRSAYFAFEAELLRTANAVKAAYYRLAFLQEQLAIQRENLSLLQSLEELAHQQNAAGKVTLQDVLRAQIERDRLQTQIENLEDSRSALVAQFKAALGLRRDESDPPIPQAFESSQETPDARSIWSQARARNPLLRRMEADVAMAQSSIDLARRSGVPDFSLGIEADVKANPTMFRPSAGVTLPIWRDKIAAEIAAAQARKSAVQARLTYEQINLATELAVMLFMYRESIRNIELLRDRLLPKAEQSLQAARTGYISDRSSFLDLIDAQRSLLDFRLALIEARTQRELALSALSLLIAAQPPEGAPLPLPRDSDQPTSSPSRTRRSSS